MLRKVSICITFNKILVLVKNCDYKKRTSIHPADAFLQKEVLMLFLIKKNPTNKTGWGDGVGGGGGETICN